MKKKYLLNGKIYTEEDLTPFAEENQLDLNTYVKEVGATEFNDVDVYEFQGKEYTGNDLADFARENDMPFQDYLKEIGVKKKVGNEPLQSDLGSGGLFAPFQYAQELDKKTIQVKQTPAPKGKYTLEKEGQTVNVTRDDIFKNIDNEEFLSGIQSGEVNIDIQNDAELGNLLNEKLSFYKSKPVEPKVATQEDIDFWESAGNSIKNVGTTLKGFFPRADVLAADVYENILGKEIAQGFYKWTGADIDKTRNNAYAKLAELEKQMLPTRGLVEAGKKKDLTGIAAGTVDAVSAIFSTALPSLATGGAGLVTEMLGGTVVDYNNIKAEEQGISVEELYQKGDAELATPMIIGSAAVGLESIGLKGIGKYINQNIRRVGTKKIADLFLTFNKEGLTEWTQTGLDEANKVLAKGGSVDDASRATADAMISEKGLESYLKGGVGASGTAIAGRFIKGKYNAITKKNKEQTDRLQKEAEVAKQIANNPTVSKEAKQAVSKEVQETEAAINEIQKQEINTYNSIEDKTEIDNLINEKNRLETIIRDESITEEQKQVFSDKLNQVNTQIDNIFNEKLKEAEKLASEQFRELEKEKIADLAQRISKGEKIESAEDLQLQQNFPKELEAELLRIKESEPTTTVSEPIQEVTAEPQVEQGVTETVSEETKPNILRGYAIGGFQSEGSPDLRPFGENTVELEKNGVVVYEQESQGKTYIVAAAGIPAFGGRTGLTISAVEKTDNLPTNIKDILKKDAIDNWKSKRDKFKSSVGSRQFSDLEYEMAERNVLKAETETVSESVTEDSGGGAEATTTVLNPALANVEATAKALEGVSEKPKISQRVIDELDDKWIFFPTNYDNSKAKFKSETTDRYDDVADFADAIGVPSEYKFLFDYLRGKGVKVRYWKEKDYGTNPANYVVSSNKDTGEVISREILLNNSPKALTSLIHEAIHAALDVSGSRKNKEFQSKLKSLQKDVANFAKNEQLVADAFRDYDAKAAKEYLDYITKKSSEEVVTFAFTNPDFARFLSYIPSDVNDQNSKSIWGKLKDIILQFIGEELGIGSNKLNELNKILDDYVFISPNDKISEAYHKAKADGSNPELVKAVEQLLTPKTETDAIQKQTAGQVPIQPEARISEKVEERTPETEPKEVAEEEVEIQNFTEGNQLNKLFRDTKEKYGDKKGASIYDATIRLVNPNQNEIVEIRSNGVVVKQGDKYTFKPFTNTDANSKKWTLGRDMDITEQFVSPKEAVEPQAVITTVKKKNAKVEKSLSDIISGKLFSEVVRDNDLTDEQSIELAKALAESTNFPKKQFSKKDKIDNDFDPNDNIDVKPIDKPIKQGKTKMDSIGTIVSKDELRPIMQGVFKDSENKRLVATDAMKMVIINDNTIKKTEIVEPKTGRIIEGNYPKYDVVIPKDNPIKRKVNVKNWLSQLNGLAETKRFFEKTIAVKIKVGDQEFAFDSELMRDVFNVMAEQGITEVELQLSKPSRALVIESNKGVMGLVMPFMFTEDYRGGSKTLLETEMTIDEKNGVVQQEIDSLEQRRKEKNNELKEAIQKFRNATAANAYSLEFDVEYHKKRLAEIDAEIAEKKSELIDNPIQEKEDLQTVKTNIENGEITTEQATEYIAKPTKRSRKTKQSIEDIESKAESDNEAELNEVVQKANALINAPKVKFKFAGGTVEGTVIGEEGGKLKVVENDGTKYTVDKKDVISEAKPEQSPEEIAKRIRNKKQRGALSAIDFGISQTLYNGALEFMAKQVESGTKLGNAIANTIKWIDARNEGKKWNKGLFGKYMNDTYTMKLNDGRTVEVVRDDSRETAEVINGWYLPIEQKILDAKEDKMPANKWADRLRSKEDEDLWTGVREYLESKGTESVTKKELQDFIKNNRVEIVEVVKGSDILTEKQKLDALGYKKVLNQEETDYAGNDVFDIQNQYGRTLATGDQNFISEWLDEEGLRSEQDNTKFPQYQLEGEKENYKEVLVTLPSRVRFADKWAFYQSKGYNKEQFDALPDETKQDLFIEFKAEDKRQRESSVADFKSTHFDEPNILVHLRMNTRTDADGNKVLFLEEIQSDFSAAYRKSQKEVMNFIDKKPEDVIELYKKSGKLEVEC